MSDKDNAKNQARAQLESIVQMVAALEVDYDRLDELKEELESACEDESEDNHFGEWVRNQAESEDGTFKESAIEYLDLLGSAGDCESEDEARQAIDEDPLSVEIRSGWYSAGDTPEPEEFQILLCTGGPAVRIMGELDQYKQPCRAWLEYQDWGTPWTHYYEQGAQETLLTYCRQFYFGD